MLLNCLTQKGYCGHWTDYQLDTTMAEKLRRRMVLQHEVDRLMQEIVFIQSERAERG